MNKIINKLYVLKKDNPDLLIKDIKLSFFSHVYIISIETITSSDKINDYILNYFMNKSLFKDKSNIKNDIKEIIPSINIKSIKEEEINYYLYNGYTIVIYKDEIISFETKAFLDRAISESTSTPSIRGPKDSFNENYQNNIGLIRKRIKSDNLCIKELTLGSETKTKVAIIYMNNISEIDLVNKVISRLNNINIDGILDTNYLKEYIDIENKTLLPTIIFSEKPDAASRFLLDGRVILLVENSPSILVCPTFFIDYISSSEDYFHKPFFSSFMRLIRLLAFFISIIMPGIFLAIINYDPEMLPLSLLVNISMQRNLTPFPAVIEAFILMFTFELLYEGEAKAPSKGTTSLSILGALVLGEAAVNAGLISPIMVIVISISAISSIVFMYHDLQGSIRFYRYLLMILSSLFGVIGFITGMEIFLLDISSISTFGKPYLLPTAPLMVKDINNSYIKRSIIKIKNRPSYLTKNIKRQG